MTRYAGDPRWIEARHPGNCRSWQPVRCGEVDARGFAAGIFNEELFGGSHA